MIKLIFWKQDRGTSRLVFRGKNTRLGTVPLLEFPCSMNGKKLKGGHWAGAFLWMSARASVALGNENFNRCKQIVPSTADFPCLHMPSSHLDQQASTMAATSSPWPPACHSAPSSCTCCCILTPHTHLSDSAGYPHLNHIIRFPHPEDTTQEALAWFHCPHCPCTLGLTWTHPDEMAIVTENVSGATWLPRFADFEAYTRLDFDDCKSTSAEYLELSPKTETTCETPASAAEVVLGDRTNVPEHDDVKPMIDKCRPKRRSKVSSRSEVARRRSPDETPGYKPRRSKYDVH
jgi:hypothetical protein